MFASVSATEGVALGSYLGSALIVLMQRPNCPWEAEGLALTAYEMVELLAKQATMEIRSGA